MTTAKNAVMLDDVHDIVSMNIRSTLRNHLPTDPVEKWTREFLGKNGIRLKNPTKQKFLASIPLHSVKTIVPASSLDTPILRRELYEAIEILPLMTKKVMEAVLAGATNKEIAAAYSRSPAQIAHLRLVAKKKLIEHMTKRKRILPPDVM